MTTYEEINNIPVTIHLLNEDMSNSAKVTNDINAYYRMLIKALDRTANVNSYKSKSNFYKFLCDEELNILNENSISAHNQWFLDSQSVVAL